MTNPFNDPRLRGLTIFCGLIAIWWLVTLTGIPKFMLPSPFSVAAAIWEQRASLAYHTGVTLMEILLGLGFGLLFGGGLALAMILSRGLQSWVMPVIVISQSIPVFAMAPLLVLWFGFGMASKVIMAVLIIFFPVVAAFFDGLRRTERGWLDLAQTMGASSWSEMRHVRLVAALPAFGSGLRVAAAVAPIGAVIGEWVGASAGLGYIMLNANARMQTDTAFAALFILALLAVLLWQVVDRLLKRVLYWVPDSGASF
ncbi:Putative aliphatic sulfonates transport permease protein SsuC (plasmid) [Paracoccaceae bacterium]|nr:Putative aliphatic sulfonates transport permease protein SsuC [Paracoccaceae bacterium]